MSAVTLDAPAPRAGAETRPGLARMTVVELRKMTDTRAGFWLIASVALLTVVLMGVMIFVAPDRDHTFREILSAAVAPASVLLPIVGILLVSSEWSQRTAVITFTLVPQRTRVLAAKVLAGIAVALAALLVGIVAAAITTAIAAPPPAGDRWDMPGWMLVQTAVSLVTGMISGVAFGALFLASAPAIVLYFVLPLAWGIIGSLPALEGAARWLDSGRTMSGLTEESFSGTEWARAATTLAVWMLLPLLVGWWRILRDEVS